MRMYIKGQYDMLIINQLLIFCIIKKIIKKIIKETMF